MREDAKSVPLQTDLGQTYASLIDLLLASGKKAEAHEQTAAALLLLRPIAQEPSATSWQIYYCAWLLENTTFPDLRDDATALRLAQRMMKKDPADPDILDVVARASARMGDATGAAALERKALAGNPAPDVRAARAGEAELSRLRRPRHFSAATPVTASSQVPGSGASPMSFWKPVISALPVPPPLKSSVFRMPITPTDEMASESVSTGLMPSSKTVRLAVDMEQMDPEYAAPRQRPVVTSARPGATTGGSRISSPPRISGRSQVKPML